MLDIVFITPEKITIWPGNEGGQMELYQTSRFAKNSESDYMFQVRVNTPGPSPLMIILEDTLLNCAEFMRYASDRIKKDWIGPESGMNFIYVDISEMDRTLYG